MHIVKRLSYIKTLLKTFSAGKIEILFSFAFAIIIVLGNLLTTYQAIDATPIGAHIVLAYVFGFLVVWGVALFGLTVVKERGLSKPNSSRRMLLAGVTDKKLWLVSSLAIFAFYAPIIIACHSVLSPDSWNGVRQLTGDLPLSNAHPLVFTALTGIFVKLGLLFGSLELGITLFSVAQSAILAMIFAWVIVWMRQEKVSKNIIVAGFLFYAVLPVNAVAGIIMWKDILFAGFGLVFLLLLRSMYVKQAGFFTKKNTFYFMLFAFLFCAWRNNGFYAYLIFSILTLAIYRKTFFNKKHLFVLLSPIALFLIYSSIASLFAKPSANVAMVSVPLQQIARTIKYHGDSISEDDKKIINEILPFDQVGEEYNPDLADPVIWLFNEGRFSEDKVRYGKLWLRLMQSHTKTYLAAFLYKSYGYTYPYYPSPTTTDTIMDNSIHVFALEGYTDQAYESGSKSLVVAYRDTISSTLPLLRHIGLYTCVVLLALYVAIIRRRKELAGVFIILFCLFLTTILGPVNGEFRYLYLFVVSTPFILVSAYVSENNLKSKRKQS